MRVKNNYRKGVKLSYSQLEKKRKEVSEEIEQLMGMHGSRRLNQLELDQFFRLSQIYSELTDAATTTNHFNSLGDGIPIKGEIKTMAEAYYINAHRDEIQ